MIKSTYSIRLENPTRLAVLDVDQHFFQGRYSISRINVPKEHRGYGHARTLLNQVCADADECGEVLYLVPSASGGLTQTQLEGWYKRNGFEFMIPGGLVMSRLPQGSKIVSVPPLRNDYSNIDELEHILGTSRSGAT